MTSHDPLALIRDGLSDREIERTTGINRRRVAKLRAVRGLPAWTPPLGEHGTNRRYRQGCRCDPCTDAHARHNAAEYAKSGRTTGRDTMTQDARDRAEQRRREALARTRDAATVHGPWTAAELRIALDMARSATEAATLLGRSKSAVEHARRRHADERWQSGPLPRGRRATRA